MQLCMPHHILLAGSSLLLYAGTGFFGAALFGSSTEGNVMVNQLTDSQLGFSVVYGCMMLYLAAGAAASQYPLRASLDFLIFGPHVPMTTGRAVSAASGRCTGVYHFSQALFGAIVVASYATARPLRTTARTCCCTQACGG